MQNVSLAQFQGQCSSVDDSFGPWAGQCRGGFDFTLLFEESILGIPLLSTFIVLLPGRWWYLSRNRRNGFLVKTWTQEYQEVVIGIWAIIDLILLILWSAAPSKSGLVRTRASIPAAALSFVVAAASGCLSWFENPRSIRPSPLLDTYLFFSVLLDIARARTLWLISPNSVITILFTCSITIRSLLGVLESLKYPGTRTLNASPLSKEEISGSYSRSVFFWLNSLFLNGYKHVLSLQELYPLDACLKTERLYSKFASAWEDANKKNEKHALLSSWAYVERLSILLPILPRLCLIGFRFTQPLLVTKAIELASQPVNQRNDNVGYGLIGAYLLVYSGIAISHGQYQHWMNRAAIKMRGAIVPSVTAKTLRIPLDQTNSAEALSHINTDIETIIPGITLLHEIWAGLLEVGIAIYLLYRQIGAACAISIAFSLAMLLFTGILAVPIGAGQAAWIEAAQLRVATTSNILSKIQWIRMSGISESAFRNIDDLRRYELQVSRKFRLLIMWVLTLASSTPIFSPVLTFITYALLAARDNDVVTISKIFTSLSLFALLASPLAIIMVTLPAITAAITSFDRIQKYLNSAEHNDDHSKVEINATKTQKFDALSKHDDCLSTPRTTPRDDDSIQMQSKSVGVNSDLAFVNLICIDGKFTWPGSTSPTLDLQRFYIRRGTFTAIVGPVGCGKSTLLKCILGELANFDGYITNNASSTAFCDQIPFMPSSTVQDVIIGTSSYDLDWFNEVVMACALTEEIACWSSLENSVIGTRGISLSGGQKQRLALARAVYSRSELVILDDSFNGLDSKTENRVYEALLGQGGLLRRGETTVILTCSQVNRVAQADWAILVTANGTIASQETPSEVLITSSLSHRNQRIDHTADKTINNRSQVNLPQGAVDESHHPIVSNSSSEDDRRQRGDSDVYKIYIKSAGLLPLLTFFGAMIILAFCEIFTNFWLKWWAEANTMAPNGNLQKWLSVYAALAIASMAAFLLGTWQVFIVCITSSGVYFHKLLVDTVSRATMDLFSSVDIGVTINRFSQDLQLIDMELPSNALVTASTFVSCVGQAITMSIASRYFAIAIPFVCAIFYCIQHFYLRTSRQLRFLDIEHKAPLYAQLLEIFDGLATIRAYKWQAKYISKTQQLLEDSQRPVYLLMSLQQWLIFCIEMVVAVMAIILITLTTTLRQQLSPGLIGIALVNVINFGEAMKALIQTWVGLEISIGAVARVKNFAMETKLEPPTKSTSQEQQSGGNDLTDWPSKGSVVFNNITASYATTNKIVTDITLSINPGEKIGICGRTGCGKSSLLYTLLHMIPIDQGIIYVDDIPITSVSPSLIRESIVAIPQEVYIFSSTVRENLDPSKKHTEDKIIETLEKVQLWTTSISPRGGLDAQIDDKFFSHGQAQLFALARAILRKPKVLLLDEITTSLDQDTTKLVQRVIEEEFRGVTVLAVAHHLDFITDFDRVVVMDQGRIIEVGEPSALMIKDNGRFRSLVEIQQGIHSTQGANSEKQVVEEKDEILPATT